MRIEQLDPAAATERDVDGLHAVQVAATAADRPGDPPPDRADVAGRLRSVRADVHRPRWVARTDAGIVGHATLRVSLLDNLHLGMVDVVVHPDHRRRGAGRALLAAVVAGAAAEGRRLLVTEADRGGPGEAFCRAVGLRQEQVDRVSLLRLADVDWPDVEAAAARKHPGYRLEAWVDACPEDLLDSYARAQNAMNDAPVDGMAFTDFAYTPATIRADEATARALGQLRVVVAVAEDTGEVAAFTDLRIHGRPERASQQDDTAVVPAHRGTGLGLWIKADMLVRLRAERPDVTEVLTGNAASNTHMLRINERLGFREHSVVLGFQGEVAALADRLGRG